MKDPNYKPQKQYPSGNEGRLHPGLRHSGYAHRYGTPDKRPAKAEILEALRGVYNGYTPPGDRRAGS